MVPLDKRPDSLGDDFQRAADLLGIRPLPDRLWQRDAVPFFPQMVLRLYGCRPAAGAGHGAAFRSCMDPRYQRHRVRALYADFGRMAGTRAGSEFIARS